MRTASADALVGLVMGSEVPHRVSRSHGGRSGGIDPPLKSFGFPHRTDFPE